MPQTNNEILLISRDALLQFSALSRNISDERIFPFVALCQQLHLAPILGEPLMEELQEEVASGEITPANKALLLKIAPFLANDTHYLALRSLAYHSDEQGMTKHSSENSTPITEKELGQYRLELMGIVDECKKLLIEFLCECRDAYPLWKPDSDVECLCKKRENDHDTTSLVYFPRKAKPKCGCGCKD